MAEHRASYFPLLLDLAGRSVTVVGGGKVAERKVRTLLACGARVRVVAPSLTDGLGELAAAGRIAYEDRAYTPGDLTGATVAFVAVDDPHASAAAAEDARRAGVLVNVVDRPELCDFIVPSVVRRGLLSIAISTAGASPAWARRIRERLEKEFGEEYARLFAALARVRKELLAEIPDPARRRKALKRLADDSLVEFARSGSEDEIVTELLRLAREEAAEE